LLFKKTKNANFTPEIKFSDKAQQLIIMYSKKLLKKITVRLFEKVDGDKLKGPKIEETKKIRILPPGGEIAFFRFVFWKKDLLCTFTEL
jgi:hypothetical protein